VSGEPKESGGTRRGESNGHEGVVSQAESQRERLIDSFTKIASEQGFVNATPEQVAAAADLPPELFHEHFSDERQCLCAAYDAFVERLVAAAEHAVDPEQDWPEGVKQGVGSALAFVSETASRSRFFAVDALVLGPMILDRYLAAIDRIARLLRSGRNHFPEAADLPPITEPVLVGGVACMVGAALLPEEESRIQGLQPQVVEFLLVPYVGRTRAQRIARS
jgi:AcrR family transcriptional regulator